MTAAFPVETGERLVGQWLVDYIAPCGCRVPGRLTVTPRRVLFDGQARPRCLQKYLVGPVEARALAYALDLDTEHLAYANERLAFVIPQAYVERLITGRTLIRSAVCLTLKDNSAVHTFQRRLFSVAALARAIQSP